ncbi:MAG: dTDP-4-amino-4,6-dideoxy-D-glucose transaminase [Sphingomonadales bacterium]|jgi:4-aminobutyrate aminotransferase-like enzyme|nr:dTDP-4-amino-4,6-dideoxy-D-glucose transaminase [Sphingomonadales bacterium]
MANDMSPNPSPVRAAIGDPRPVPGPRSKAIFAAEAEVMAPGLQSIALYSQIAVDHASGCTITDADGAEYLDFIAGIAVGSLGHGHPHYVARLREQLGRATFGSFTTANRARFLALLRSVLPPGLTHVQLFSGGAEAVEAAMRLAKSVTGKYEFLGFWGAFHGKTGGVAPFLGGTSHQNLGPGAPGVHMAPYANCYRCPWNLQHPSCGLACAEHLRAMIRTATRHQLAAILIEPMQGTAGNVIPPDDFLPAVKAIAHEFDALLIADEVLTGFGRTGTMFASEQSGTVPDVMTLGKGMGGGFPLSGVASSLEAMSARPFGEPSGSSSSYGGNPLAATAGLAAVEAIIDEALVANAARIGAIMLDRLRAMQERHRCIGDVRGRGLLIGVELVADRATKVPLERDITFDLFQECLKRGLIAMAYSHAIRINPPLVITEEQALQGLDILEEALAVVERRFGLG